MSDVRVNLLPPEVGERERARRERGIGLAAVVGVLLILVVLYVVQVAQVGQARDQLAIEQQRVSELQAELAELAEYRDLAAQREEAFALLSAVLITETSYAGVLQNLAAVFPTDAELTNLTLATLDVEGGVVTPELGDVRIPYGTLTATGRTLARFAPGIERLLLDLDKIAAFSDVYLTSSMIDADEAVAFTVEVDLGEELRTRRYVEGLPEGLR